MIRKCFSLMLCVFLMAVILCPAVAYAVDDPDWEEWLSAHPNTMYTDADESDFSALINAGVMTEEEMDDPYQKVCRLTDLDTGATAYLFIYLSGMAFHEPEFKMETSGEFGNFPLDESGRYSAFANAFFWIPGELPKDGYAGEDGITEFYNDLEEERQYVAHWSETNTNEDAEEYFEVTTIGERPAYITTFTEKSTQEASTYEPTGATFPASFGGQTKKQCHVLMGELCPGLVLELNIHAEAHASAFGYYQETIHNGRSYYQDMCVEMDKMVRDFVERDYSWSYQFYVPGGYVPTPVEPEEPMTGDGWTHDSMAEEKGGVETGVLIPATAAAVLVGGGTVLNRRKKAKKAAEEEKKEQEEEEEQFRYAIRVYKNFGDTLVSGEEPQPVYARIVRIDTRRGKEVTDSRLTSLIQISSPDYLKVTDRQRSGEYIGAFVSAPEENGGRPIPSEAVVAFSVAAKGGKFTERLHFQVKAGAEIVFFQENLGLPAHYEKEARLLFYAGNVPESAELKASLVYAHSPYEVELEQHPEDPNFWYAVLRDIRPDDKGDPGDTKEWALRVEVVDADGKTLKENTISIFRVHLGLSLLLEGNAVGCYLKASDRLPAMTSGRLLLLEWDEENQQIVRVAPVWKPEDWTVKAERSVNNAKANYGMSDQQRVDALGIMAIPAGEIDENGAQVFYLTSTKAALDRPTRVWTEVSVRVEYNDHEYRTSKRVLLHSMPFRQFESIEEYAAVDKEDQKIFDQLMSIRTRIMPIYYQNLFSLYDLIDRMTDGYDVNFGFDQNQVDNVMKIWIGFIEGRKTGANAEAERLTLADDLAAAYAFLEGMRDNGGLLGRIALGVCTAGYSETVFFTMDLYEKMETAVNNCSGDEFGFWDGVVMGVKEYEISLAQELLLKGALKGGNKVIGHLTGYDVGKTITTNYSRFIGDADKTLRASSTLYARGAKVVDSMTAFTNGSAKALADARQQSANARAAAKQRVDAKFGTEKLSIAERRQGMRYKDLTPEQMQRVIDYDLAMEDGMNKVRALDQARKEVKLGSEDYWKKKAEYEERVFDILDDPNAKKQLRALGGEAGLTNRAELNRVRKEFQQKVQKQFLDNCAERTGRPRDELYVQSVSSNKVADELAGKTLSEDWDVTAAQEVRTNRARDIIIGQTVGEEELAKAAYEVRYGKKAPDIATAKKLTQRMDITYVSPGMDYGYVIEHNPEAYFELSKMIDKSKYGEALSSPTMTRLTIEHKAKENYRRGDAFYQEAYRLEAEAAAASTPEARTELLNQARKLRSSGQGAYVEGTRQLKKTVDNIADERNAYRISRGEGDLFTAEHRELQELDRRVGSREPNEICPEEFFVELEKGYGLDKYSLADKMAETFS